MTIDQWAIMLLGPVAVWLAQSGHPRRAAIVGLTIQPAWFYAAYTAEQWGIFAVCIVYTAAWARGLWTSNIAKPSLDESGS